MATITGRIEDDRLRIKVGIRASQPHTILDPFSPVGLDLNYHECTALIDTGARRTCVSEGIVQAVGLKRRGRAEVWNIKRPELHWTYLFHVAIWPDIELGEAPPAPFGIGEEIEGIDVGNNRFFDVLIGMDILSQGSLHLERTGAFRLNF